MVDNAMPRRHRILNKVILNKLFAKGSPGAPQ